MVTKYKIFIFSQNPDELVKFYTDTLGFKLLKKLDLPKDYGYMVEAAPGYEIWLAQHSEVSGINREPVRHMINFYTDSFLAIFQKIKSHPQVKFLQEPISMSEFIPGETRQVFTVLDTDGNCLQFMGS